MNVAFEHGKGYIAFTDMGGQFTFEFGSLELAGVISGKNLSHPDKPILYIDTAKCVAFCELTESDMLRIEAQKEAFEKSWKNYQSGQSAPVAQNYM
jgi:hypothetical protein